MAKLDRARFFYDSILGNNSVLWMTPYGFDNIVGHVFFLSKCTYHVVWICLGWFTLKYMKQKIRQKRASFYLQGKLSFQVEGQFNSCFKSTLFIAFSGQRRLLGAISFEVVSIFFQASLSIFLLIRFHLTVSWSMINLIWHEIFKQDKCISLAPPMGNFYKPQPAVNLIFVCFHQ